MMPAGFLGHGNPMNALERNRYTDAWRAFGQAVPRPRAILVISAHWYTNATAVTAMPRPRTIHDFYGFPQELFDVEYPAPGAPDVAELIADVVKPTWVGMDIDSWGIDHGTWSVLLHAFPDASIPVVQLSLNAFKSFDHHLELGRKLSALREQGVLIIGSGNIVHNLRMVDSRNPTPPDWALAFRDRVNGHIAAGEFRALADFESLADARLAAPTPEHYLPLLYALALARPGDDLELFNDDVWSTLSMTSLAIGMNQRRSTRH